MPFNLSLFIFRSIDFYLLNLTYALVIWMSSAVVVSRHSPKSPMPKKLLERSSGIALDNEERDPCTLSPEIQVV